MNKPNQTPQKVIDKAKEMYLSINSDNQRLYSNRAIAKEITKDVNLVSTVSHTTIGEWERKNNWDNLPKILIISELITEKSTQQPQRGATFQFGDLTLNEGHTIRKSAQVYDSALDLLNGCLAQLSNDDVLISKNGNAYRKTIEVLTPIFRANKDLITMQRTFKEKDNSNKVYDIADNQLLISTNRYIKARDKEKK